MRFQDSSYSIFYLTRHHFFNLSDFGTELFFSKLVNIDLGHPVRKKIFFKRISKEIEYSGKKLIVKAKIQFKNPS